MKYFIDGESVVSTNMISVMKFRVSIDTAGRLYQFQQKGKKIIRGTVTKRLSDLLILGG